MPLFPQKDDDYSCTQNYYSLLFQLFIIIVLLHSVFYFNLLIFLIFILEYLFSKISDIKALIPGPAPEGNQNCLHFLLL